MAKKTAKEAVASPKKSEERLIGLDRLATIMRDSATEVNRLRTRAFSHYSGNEDLFLMQLVRDLNEMLEQEFGVTQEEE